MSSKDLHITFGQVNSSVLYILLPTTRGKSEIHLNCKVLQEWKSRISLFFLHIYIKVITYFCQSTQQNLYVKNQGTNVV